MKSVLANVACPVTHYDRVRCAACHGSGRLVVATLGESQAVTVESGQYLRPHVGAWNGGFEMIGQRGHVAPPRRDKSGEELPEERLPVCRKCGRVVELCVCGKKGGNRA